MEVSGIILAGGRSSRMGRDKTLLLFNNETLIERIVKELKGVVDDIIIASGRTVKYNIDGIPEVCDAFAGAGPMGGLHAGLMAAKHHYAFVISCDMPFFEGRMVKFLVDRCNSYAAVVPFINGKFEPLCAVYSKECLEPIEKCLLANERKVLQFYPQVKLLKISESDLGFGEDLEKIFYNLNTPQDLASLPGQPKLL